MTDRRCAHASTHTQDTFNHKSAEPQIVTEWALYLMDPEFGAGLWNDGEFNIFENVWKESSWCEGYLLSRLPCMVKKLCPLFCQTAVAWESKKDFRQTVPLKVHQVFILEFSRLQILKCKLYRFCLSAEPTSKPLGIAPLAPRWFKLLRISQLYSSGQADTIPRRKQDFWLFWKQCSSACKTLSLSNGSDLSLTTLKILSVLRMSLPAPTWVGRIP